MAIFTKSIIILNVVLLCILLGLSTYITFLKKQNEQLQISNDTLQTTLDAKIQESQKHQKELQTLNSKLNLLRHQAQKEEDKINDAISNNPCSAVKLSDDIVKRLR